MSYMPPLPPKNATLASRLRAAMWYLCANCKGGSPAEADKVFPNVGDYAVDEPLARPSIWQQVKAKSGAAFDIFCVVAILLFFPALIGKVIVGVDYILDAAIPAAPTKEISGILLLAAVGLAAVGTAALVMWLTTLANLLESAWLAFKARRRAAQ